MGPTRSHFTDPQEFLDAIDRAFEAFCDAKKKDDARLGVVADARVDIAERSVEYRKANQTVTEPFGLVREYLDSLPDKEPEEVSLILGDGEFLKHIRDKLSRLRQLLKNQIGTKDERLDRCARACVDAEQVMCDGLMYRLRDAVAEKNDQKIMAALEACFAGFLQDVGVAELNKALMLSTLSTEWEARNAKLKLQGRKSLGAMPEQEVSKMIDEVVSSL